MRSARALLRLVNNNLLVKVGINASFLESGFLGLGKLPNMTIHGVYVLLVSLPLLYGGRGKRFNIQKTTATLGAIAMLNY